MFAGDHGVHAQGVTPWPQEVTAQMVANFLASTAVVNVIAAQAGAEVCVVDVGVAADLPAAPGLLPRKVRRGTADMTETPAMSLDEARQAVEVGIETARDLFAGDPRVRVLTGDARTLIPDHGPFVLLFADGGTRDYAGLVDLLAIGGRIVVDDVTPEDALPPDSPFRGHDPKREFFFGDPRLVSVEVVLPDLRNSLLVGTRTR